MRYIELKKGNKIINSQREIDKILELEGFNWLVDSEIEEAKIEIKNNTLIWHGGVFYSGNWEYGIFREGEFYGKFINGIFESGEFKGNWISGVKS
jgi:hypothetical protein